MKYVIHDQVYIVATQHPKQYRPRFMTWYGTTGQDVSQHNMLITLFHMRTDMLCCIYLVRYVYDMYGGAISPLGIFFVHACMKPNNAIYNVHAGDNNNRDALLWRHNGRGGFSNHQPHDLGLLISIMLSLTEFWIVYSNNVYDGITLHTKWNMYVT